VRKVNVNIDEGRCGVKIGCHWIVSRLCAVLSSGIISVKSSISVTFNAKTSQ
jgi:hypothetical protein